MLSKIFFEKSYVVCSLYIANIEENFENHIERSILKKKIRNIELRSFNTQTPKS